MLVHCLRRSINITAMLGQGLFVFMYVNNGVWQYGGKRWKGSNLNSVLRGASVTER